MAIAIVTTRFTFFNPPLIAETYAHKLCPMSSSGPRGYPLVVTTGALPTGYLPTGALPTGNYGCGRNELHPQKMVQLVGFRDPRAPKHQRTASAAAVLASSAWTKLC